jgi:YfiH family protein
VRRELTLAPEVRGALSVYPFVDARRLGVDAFVTDRFGGASVGRYESLNLGDHVGDDDEHVQENRRRVAVALGVTRLVIVRQVHGAEVTTASTATSQTRSDAIFGDTTEVGIAVLVADCVPVLLVDEASMHFCVAHAGWRGLHSGILRNSVNTFATPRTVHAFIGPSISPEGYQVGPEVADLFASVPHAVLADSGDRSRLDLRRVATHQLTSLGIREDNLTVARQSTDGGETFFSDRAARPCGRFALVATRVLT